MELTLITKQSDKVSPPTQRIRARTRKHILIIDYDTQLADVLRELIKDNGIAATIHNCSHPVCTCAERVLSCRPNLVMVNIAKPSGWKVDLRGLRCLQRVMAHPRAKHYPAVGYTIFDSYALADLSLDPNSLGIHVHAGLTNPGLLADEVAMSIGAMVSR